ncbi:MAG: hypothetical protein KBG55_06600 [Polaromonas sp.]|nr:hypothetical protein [Polaromonas sp.]
MRFPHDPSPPPETEQAWRLQHPHSLDGRSRPAQGEPAQFGHATRHDCPTSRTGV